MKENTVFHTMNEQNSHAASSPLNSDLTSDVTALLKREPTIAQIIGLQPDQFSNEAELLARVLAAACPESSRSDIYRVALQVFATDHPALYAALTDIAVTSRKNFEPGGETTTLLFSRGIHALLGYRVTHSLWTAGDHDLALALKTSFGRQFSTDIHPAARIGKGIWLDHGLGFVVGETTIIGDDVSIWHGVTLGSTLKDNSAQRHPHIGKGVTIGADAIVLGNVQIGEGSVIAAGAIVLSDVAPDTTVAGVPARTKQRSRSSFSGF
ncbi:MAG: serine O-acetyltransferase [Brucellaceae bacterium]|nr:serine O-acetyltransferase [Brucellaceae bacterium]